MSILRRPMQALALVLAVAGVAKLALPSHSTLAQHDEQLAASKRALEDKDPVVRRAAVDKLTDQALLAKIAIEDEDRNVRSAAIARLSDAVLAKIAVWVKPHLTERVADQGLLRRIANEAKEPSVRVAAVRKLTDQGPLQKIAVEDKDPYVRGTAVAKLADRGLLAKIAIDDKDSHVRGTAAAKISDQGLLARIAVEDKDRHVRNAAAEKLSDQGLLRKIAFEAKDSSVRSVAVKKLNDQGLLRKIAVADEDGLVRLDAAEKLTDAELLQRVAGRIAVEGKDRYLRAIAVSKLTEQGQLAKVALEDMDGYVRIRAVEKLADQGQLVRVGVEANARRIRFFAVKRLIDLARSEKNAVKDGNPGVSRSNGRELRASSSIENGEPVARLAAILKLTDQAALGQIAQLSKSSEEQTLVLAKLEDRAVLNRIAAAPVDPALRLAAAIKAGSVSWAQAMSDATAQGSAAQLLDDTAQALTLFPTKDPEAARYAERLALALIGRGDASRLPELEILLEIYGDKQLAEDYLNSGQLVLRTAAESWAPRHGYYTGGLGPGGTGSHRATWGRK
jgi:hypothetical protein